MMRICIASLGLLLSGLAWSTSPIFQRCQPMGLTTQEAALSVQKPTLIVLHNVSKRALWLTHIVEDAEASASWTSKLAVGQYSALYLTPGEKEFNLACVQSEPGHEQHVSCQEVMRACRLAPDKKYKGKNRPFWAVENVKKSELIPVLAQRGFEWSLDETS